MQRPIYSDSFKIVVERHASRKDSGGHFSWISAHSCRKTANDFFLRLAAL
jgi:hypothetical protein